MLRTLIARARSLREYLSLPPGAKAARKEDRRGLPGVDPGPVRAVEEAVGWLCHAQDSSNPNDGGVARHFSLIHGWASSYPETTGYIIPTLLAYARSKGDEGLRDRVRRMLDWLVSIQFPDGGFQGGVTGSQPFVPVVFNTGQILLGLAAGAREWGEVYGEPMLRAADWLLKVQDHDGCWRTYSSPFAMAGEHTHDTHVAWGLFEAARIARSKLYRDAGLANVRWAISRQIENGWFDNCCLSDTARPLTHTIAYALRGIVEAHRFAADSDLLAASIKTADGLLGALGPDGFLPGRLNSDWKGTVEWACLTGTAQIAYCWFYMFTATGNPRYLEAGRRANRFVRRCQTLDGPPDTRGAVKGSFPISGAYGKYEYLNWACKFFIDSNLFELDLCEDGGHVA